MRFELRVTKNLLTRLLACLVFYNLKAEPKIGDKIYFITGNNDTYLQNAVVVAKGGRTQRHIWDEFAFIHVEKLRGDGSLLAMHSVPLHRIVKNNIITRLFVKLVN